MKKFKILKLETIGTSSKKHVQKPQTGSYNEWFMKSQYSKILEEAEKL